MEKLIIIRTISNYQPGIYSTKNNKEKITKIFPKYSLTEGLKEKIYRNLISKSIRSKLIILMIGILKLFKKK